MGAFLLGGLVGAAAVIYFSRSRNLSFAGFSSQTSDSVGKMMASNPSADKESDWKKIEQIVNSDNEIKKTVNEIMQKQNETGLAQ
jgi:hypothetical protein